MNRFSIFLVATAWVILYSVLTISSYNPELLKQPFLNAYPSLMLIEVVAWIPLTLLIVYLIWEFHCVVGERPHGT